MNSAFEFYLFEVGIAKVLTRKWLTRWKSKASF